MVGNWTENWTEDLAKKVWDQLEAKWREEEDWLEDWYDSVNDGAETQKPENFPVCGLCSESVNSDWYWAKSIWAEFTEENGMWLCGDCIKALDEANQT